MSLFKFRITMRHDHGEVAITTFARDIASAINIVLSAERAPERAIINIRRLKNGKHKSYDWG